MIHSISRPSSLQKLCNLLIFLLQAEGYISVAPGFKMEKVQAGLCPDEGNVLTLAGQPEPI